MNSGAPRLICFDLGGVIVRICRSWREGCLAAGIAPDGFDPADVPAFGELNRLHQTGQIDLATYAERLSAALEGRCDPRDIETVYSSWILGEYEGVAELVESIHDAGLATAALSNTSAEHWRDLLDCPAIARIQHLCASHLLGLVKPDPAIYRAFEQRVGLAGTEILFFDDLPENVAAAREAGWRAVRVDHAQPTPPQIANALVEHGIELDAAAVTPARRRPPGEAPLR